MLALSAGKPTLITRIPVKGNPNKMVLNKAQNRLYVALDNADVLVVIDTSANKVLSQVNTTDRSGVLGEGDRKIPKGSNPNSVTLSPDEKTAYVTDGGTNAVAVISLRGKQPVVRGLIPTGWQPNSVSVSPDGSTLYVVNGKRALNKNLDKCAYYAAL